MCHVATHLKLFGARSLRKPCSLLEVPHLLEAMETPTKKMKIQKKTCEASTADLESMSKIVGFEWVQCGTLKENLKYTAALKMAGEDLEGAEAHLIGGSSQATAAAVEHAKQAKECLN